MTPSEFRPIFEQGLVKQRQPYEVARLQAVPLVNVHLQKGKTIKDPKKLFKFSWDTEKKTRKKEQPEFDFKELDKKYAKYFKKDAKE